jgi:hypothetical protein
MDWLPTPEIKNKKHITYGNNLTSDLSGSICNLVLLNQNHITVCRIPTKRHNANSVKIKFLKKSYQLQPVAVDIKAFTGYENDLYFLFLFKISIKMIIL